MRTLLKQSIIRVLLACDGVPMPETALVGAVQLHARPNPPTAGDVLEALRDVEAGGYAAGVTDEFTAERSWTLTTKGTHKGRHLA